MSTPFLFPLFSVPDAPFGLAYTYAAGTTSPKVTWSDAAGTIPNTNPVQLDSIGRATIRLDPGSYDIIVKDQTNTVTIWSELSYDSQVIVYSQTASELAASITIVNSIYPPGNMLRYGIVPNDTGSRASNTTIAQALFTPTVTNGPQGQFYFPNTTGTDTYYFGNVILIRPDVYIDLGGCAMDYTSTCLSTETNSGLFFFLSDGGLQNGTINVACVASATTGCGHAIFVGARGVDTPLVTVYDSTYTPSLGRLVFRNLNINVNNTGTQLASSGAIEMLGGIRNILFENITINLNSTTPYGIIYEFGWATNPGGTGTSQTSHMHNAQFRNIRVINVGNQDGGSGAGLYLGGAYNAIIDGLYVYNSPVVFTFTPGESLFYKPWVTVDDEGAKHNITLRNIVGGAITGTGLSLVGATLASGGYLSATIAGLGHPADYLAQTDLMSFSVDGFAISAAGFGITVSGPCDIRNGILNGAAASGQLVVDDECVQGTFTNLKILNGSSTGVRTQLSGAIWSPARLKQLIFDNCIVAGNTTNGYLLTNSRSVHIRGGRIGYSTLYDGAAETVQVNCVNVAGASGGAGVMVDSAYCTPGTAGTVYVGTGSTAGNDVRNPKGTITFSGTWMINGLVNATSTVIADKTSIVNTADKYAGKLAYDTSNHRMLVALGSADVSIWELCDGTVAITPA